MRTDFRSAAMGTSHRRDPPRLAIGHERSDYLLLLASIGSMQILTSASRARFVRTVQIAGRHAHSATYD